MRYFLLFLLFLIVATVSILGFRGSKSTQPPIIVFPDMDFQPKFKPQSSNTFFANGMDDRPPVPGTVARGLGLELKNVFSEDYTYAPAENPSLYSGRDANGDWYRGYPLPVTNGLLELGREKYTIFCQVCHGASGNGNGITKPYGMIATPSYTRADLLTMAEGEIYNTIVHGKNSMGPYGDKLITPEERWAVVAYVRALQLSLSARPEDVPPQQRSQLGL